MLSVLCAHVSSDPFNLTSFSVISDPNEFETIEWDDEGEYEGGGPLDRVVVNNWPEVYMRMCVTRGMTDGLDALAIMIDNDVTQTKFIGYNPNWQIPASFISKPFHMVIENVWINTETSSSDAGMDHDTKIHINDNEYQLWCTWTSTVKPDNTTVELDCEVVKTDGNIVTAKCNSGTTWPESVFNRIPIWPLSGAMFGGYNTINQALFGTKSFEIEGSITQSWDGITRYNVTTNDDGSSLILGNQLTIKNLPIDFVSHWIDMDVEALMGQNRTTGNRAMLVPPNDS